MKHFRLDPPLSREEWFIILSFALVALFAGYAYGKWVFGV